MVNDGKAKRWRLRLSVRTLLIVVTVIGVSIAGWQQTASRGCPDVYWFDRHTKNICAIAPFVIAADRIEVVEQVRGARRVLTQSTRPSYYLWFYGVVVPVK